MLKSSKTSMSLLHALTGNVLERTLKNRCRKFSYCRLLRWAEVNNDEFNAGSVKCLSWRQKGSKQKRLPKCGLQSTVNYHAVWSVTSPFALENETKLRIVPVNKTSQVANITTWTNHPSPPHHYHQPDITLHTSSASSAPASAHLPRPG